jgi:DNA polymerase-3 subunit beta
MKLSVLQTHLLTALTKIGKIISPRAQLPILQNFLIEAKNNKLTIAGTNTETSMVTHVAAKIEKEGGVCVPAKLFTEFIMTLPDDAVSVNFKDSVVTAKCNGYEASLPCVVKEEFPPIPHEGKTMGIHIPKETLLSALDGVLYAAATDEGRPVLTGIKIRKSDEDTLFVATDGYRLSLRRVLLAMEGKNDITIPARALTEVVHVGQENKEEETITMKNIDETQLGFFVGDTEIYTRVIDGEYPNFEKILPKHHTTRTILNTEAFTRAVKSASIFARDNANIIKIHITKGEFVVSANTPEIGQNKIIIESDTDGEGGDIAFNSRFVLDFLNHFSDEKVVFEMTGSLNPGVFKPAGEDDFLHIIMPVRTAN